MKYLFIALLASTLLFAKTDKLIIDAKNFEANDAKGISIFTGDVKLTKAKDLLLADKLEVYMTPNVPGTPRTPIKYIATGKVEFEIVSNGKEYEGKGDKVIYNPAKQQYTIIGNGFLKEKIEDRKLYGDKIYINQLTGEAKVSGTKNKPVRFILNVESKDEKPAPKKEEKAKE